MPRNYAQVMTSIWQDPEWRNLTQNAQHTYLMLLSQPGLSYCGVLPLTPTRWASYTEGSDVPAGLVELAQARFIVIDQPSEELLIRSFMKHNGVLKNPKLRSAMHSQWKNVVSKRLRDYIYESLPVDDRPERLKDQVDCGTDPNTENQDCGSDPDTGSFHPTNLLTSNLLTSSSTAKSEDEEIIAIAAKLIAEQRRRNRRPDAEPIASIEAWVRNVESNVVSYYREQAVALLRTHPDWTPEQLANELEPPTQPPPPKVPKRAPCPECGGTSGMTLNDRGEAIKCPSCSDEMAVSA